MNRPELYEKSVNAILDAYSKGELVHMNACGCAVGNICKEMGTKFGISNSLWIYPVENYRRKKEHSLLSYYPDSLVELGKTLIRVVGYSAQELHDIELAFENNAVLSAITQNGRNDSSKMFSSGPNALNAVMQMLAYIHDADNPEIVKEVKIVERVEKRINELVMV